MPEGKTSAFKAIVEQNIISAPFNVLKSQAIAAAEPLLPELATKVKALELFKWTLTKKYNEKVLADKIAEAKTRISATDNQIHNLEGQLAQVVVQQQSSLVLKTGATSTKASLQKQIDMQKSQMQSAQSFLKYPWCNPGDFNTEYAWSSAETEQAKKLADAVDMAKQPIYNVMMNIFTRADYFKSAALVTVDSKGNPSRGTSQHVLQVYKLVDDYTDAAIYKAQSEFASTRQ